MNEVTNMESGNLPEISEEYGRAVRLHGAIVADAQAAAYHLISLGKNLKEMNDGKLYKQLGYESLGDYASESVGLKGRAAYNYISAYETYGESGLQKYGALGITKLTELIRLPPDERAELLENDETAEMSTRELQARIDELKKKNEQLTFELEEKSERVDEWSDMQREIDRLKAALEEEQKTKVLPAPEMSEAEKKDLRKTIEAETEARHAEEIKQAVGEERRKAAAAVKNAQEAEKKAKAAEKEIAQKEEEAREELDAVLERERALAEKLAAAEKENAVLQANAKKPLPTEAKERVKVHAKIVLDNFEAAAQVVRTADEAEREKLKEGLVKMAAQIGKIAESL